MSSDASLALLLDGPMQSWGYASRFDRRATALHPTRSGVTGLICAAMGIDKNVPDESDHIQRLLRLRVTTVTFARTNHRGQSLPVQRLEDYHTVTGYRRASGKLAPDATVQTYRQYLLDARFGVLLQGSATTLSEIAVALQNPKWGIWFGRKSCLPATPVLAAGPGEYAEVWKRLMERAGIPDSKSLEEFDHVVEVEPGDPAADMIYDTPVGFGRPIGERHSPRWIKRISKSTRNNVQNATG